MSNERIWIFVLGKTPDAEQEELIKAQSKSFVEGWTAHEQKLSASFEFYKHAMLIFKVDEAVYNASGCSIDKLTRFIKSLEQATGIDFLNRLNVAYEKSGEVIVTPSSAIGRLLNDKAIDGDTIVFDNTISSSAQLNEWKKPLRSTWLSKYLPEAV